DLCCIRFLTIEPRLRNLRLSQEAKNFPSYVAPSLVKVNFRNNYGSFPVSLLNIACESSTVLNPCKPPERVYTRVVDLIRFLKKRRKLSGPST
ncbi:hypothetical protein HAX54_051536, partial [Datura stramonium]|nr:hypothetical protein [Datura stramonium]